MHVWVDIKAAHVGSWVGVRTEEEEIWVSALLNLMEFQNHSPV